MARLRSAPPRYVVALNEVACSRSPSPDERKLMGRAEALMRCLDDLPGLDEFVSARFVKERAIGPLEVWRVRSGSVAGTATAVFAWNAKQGDRQGRRVNSR